MSPQEYQFYQRQILLPEVGVAGQRRLKQLSVLLVGAGGLGSPAAIYLAAAGVGRLGLADHDTVEASNLHRQTLYEWEDIGKEKAKAAAAHLEAQNPFIKVEPLPVRLGPGNAKATLSGYDIVLEGSDNFATKYLVNATCVQLKKPLILASVMRGEGQMSVYCPEQNSPCYACIYPEPPPVETMPNCAEAGVLGVVPGILGLFQAGELLRYALRFGESSVGKLRVFDLGLFRLDSFAVKKDARCPACGNNSAAQMPTPVGACATAAETDSVTPTQLKASLKKSTRPLLLDVRSAAEFSEIALPGAKNLSWEEFLALQMDRHAEIVVYCLKGQRSRAFLNRMQAAGFTRGRHLTGGILKWLTEFGD